MRTERTSDLTDGAEAGPGQERGDQGATGRARRVVARALVGLLHVYQLVVSPWFAPRCRYYPSCSQYAVVSLSRHGAVRGTGMAIWRVLRCNPWSLGGVDHVPEHTRSARTLIDSLPANPPQSRHAGGGCDLT